MRNFLQVVFALSFAAALACCGGSSGGHPDAMPTDRTGAPGDADVSAETGGVTDSLSGDPGAGTDGSARSDNQSLVDAGLADKNCIPECVAGYCGADSCGASCPCAAGFRCPGPPFQCLPDCALHCAGRLCGKAGPDEACWCGACDDNDPCTTDLCSDKGECAYEPVRSCDGNPCTVNDTCKNGTCTPGADGGGLLFQQSCYRWFAGAVGFGAAESACRAWGGHLVTISTKEENQFVLGQLKGISWIGFSDSLTEGTWLWTSGEAPVANIKDFWAPGEPNDSLTGEDCAVMINGGALIGAWNDVMCDPPWSVPDFKPPVSAWAPSGYVCEAR